MISYSVRQCSFDLPFLNFSIVYMFSFCLKSLNDFVAT